MVANLHLVEIMMQNIVCHCECIYRKNLYKEYGKTDHGYCSSKYLRMEELLAGDIMNSTSTKVSYLNGSFTNRVSRYMDHYAGKCIY
jgi:hypothetical protein